jgi:hypothetical protein
MTAPAASPLARTDANGVTTFYDPAARVTGKARR